MDSSSPSGNRRARSRAGTGCDHLKAVVTCSLAVISEPSRFEFRVDFWSPRWISGSRCGFLELWVVATSKSKLSGSCGIRWLRVRRPLPPAPSRSSNLRANGPVPTIAGGNSQTALGLLEDSSKYLEPKDKKYPALNLWSVDSRDLFKVLVKKWR